MKDCCNQIIREILEIKTLLTPSNKLLVWALIPYRMTEQGLIQEFFNTLVLHQELENVFAELGLKWKWQPITLENMDIVIEEVATSMSDHIPVILNYCIGDEILTYPGTRVYELLEARNIPCTGADSASMKLSTSKIRMKRAFIKADIPTARYEVISDINCLQGICERLETPLFVKPDMSFSSRGLSLQSVIYNDEQAISQVQRLLQGQHGMQCLYNEIFVERFITGREFTVFLIGSFKQPDKIIVYPPVEVVFHSKLPETEKFLSYGRYHEKYEEEMPLSPEEPFVRSQLVSTNLQERLCELAKRAYCAVGGNGFGRVDIRMEKASQELFVLEVNPNCLIAPSETFVGEILNLTDIPFAQLISEIMTEALTRNNIKF